MQRIAVLSDEEELKIELAETREELATAKGRLEESHRSHRNIMVLCDALLAINVFMVLLLTATRLGWI